MLALAAVLIDVHFRTAVDDRILALEQLEAVDMGAAVINDFGQTKVPEFLLDLAEEALHDAIAAVVWLIRRPTRRYLVFKASGLKPRVVSGNWVLRRNELRAGVG